MQIQRIDDIVDRSKYFFDIIKIPSFKWKWYFDKEDSTRMVMWVNSRKGKLFNIASREIGNRHT